MGVGHPVRVEIERALELLLKTRYRLVDHHVTVGKVRQGSLLGITTDKDRTGHERP